jgi:aldehyde dehydrogenase (NAD+)
MGDPSDKATTLGPLADATQLQRVLGFIEAGKTGAQLLVGGERKGERGAFVTPTIFLNPSKDSTIYKEEIFGPVLTVLTFETEEEAIKLANDTSYGLSGKSSMPETLSLLTRFIACVYTSNIARALRVSSKIKAGTIGVNSAYLPDNNLPFGGYRQSGAGRELGKEGLMAYLQAKAIKIYVGP